MKKPLAFLVFLSLVFCLIYVTHILTKPKPKYIQKCNSLSKQAVYIKPFNFLYGASKRETVEHFEENFPRSLYTTSHENLMQIAKIHPADSTMYEGVYVAFRDDMAISVWYVIRLPGFVNTIASFYSLFDAVKARLDVQFRTTGTEASDNKSRQYLWYLSSGEQITLRAAASDQEKMISVEFNCLLDSNSRF